MVNQPGLGEAIHTSSNFDIDVTVFDDFGGKFVVLDVVGQVGEFETHICEAGHRSAQVEILDVNRHKFGVWGQHNAV